MDWFLYDNGLYHERVNKEVGIQKPFFDYYFINVGYYFKVSRLLSKLLFLPKLSPGALATRFFI